MHITALVLSLLLAFVMLGSGVMKLIHAPRVVTMMEAVHVTQTQMSALGVIEVAATAGLIAGLWLHPLAIAAAAGVTVYFLGAILAHRRASDPDLQGAVVLLVLAVVTLVALLLAL